MLTEGVQTVRVRYTRAPGSLPDVPVTFKHSEFESPTTPNDDEDN